jgi:hypothetical protein
MSDRELEYMVNELESMSDRKLESNVNEIIYKNQDKLHQIPNIEQLVSGVLSEANPISQPRQITFEEFEYRLNDPDKNINPNMQQESLLNLEQHDRLCLFVYLQRYNIAHPTLATTAQLQQASTGQIQQSNKTEYEHIIKELTRMKSTGAQLATIIKNSDFNLRIISLLSKEDIPHSYRTGINHQLKTDGKITPKLLNKIGITSELLQVKKGGKTKKSRKSKNKTRRRYKRKQ